MSEEHTLFPIDPLPKAPIVRGASIRDSKGRPMRRPWWEDLGRGPEEMKCRDCRHLVYRQEARRYYKCGRQPATRGPGIDIAASDEACRLFEAVQEE